MAYIPISPIIRDGDLQTTADGDLLNDYDIKTQLTVALTGYDCIFDDTLVSSLYSLFNSSTPINQTVVTNIVKYAYDGLIKNKIIDNLQLEIPLYNGTDLIIKIQVTSDYGENVSIYWSHIT